MTNYPKDSADDNNSLQTNGKKTFCLFLLFQFQPTQYHFHHPHKGYEGEIPELKIDCDCRKPKPGMLLRAAKDFNIDLQKSYMVGDSESDILAGKAAGCKTVLIGEDDYGQDYTTNSLLAFVKQEIDNNPESKK